MPARPQDVDADPRGGRATEAAVVLAIVLLAVAVLATGSAGGHLGGGRSVVLSQGLTGFLVGSGRRHHRHRAVGVAGPGAEPTVGSGRRQAPDAALALVAPLAGRPRDAWGWSSPLAEWILGPNRHRRLRRAGPLGDGLAGRCGTSVSGAAASHSHTRPVLGSTSACCLAVLVGMASCSWSARGHAPSLAMVADDDDEPLLTFPERLPLVAALDASLDDLGSESPTRGGR